MLSCSNKKGQAVAEMALFGSLVLLIFATLLSYMQRLNDQQYVQMEAFRRGLQKANDHEPPVNEGTGASVQFSLIENRRYSDISGEFRKGSAQTLSASSNVFWAVPAGGKQAESLIAYRINEDEKVANLKEFIPQEKSKEWSFRTEEPTFRSALGFINDTAKVERPGVIINEDSSRFQDTITTVIPYTIRLKDEDNDPDNDPIVPGTKTEIFFAPKQGLYIDTNGQYKYSEATTGTIVGRRKTWTTPF